MLRAVRRALAPLALLAFLAGGFVVVLNATRAGREGARLRVAPAVQSPRPVAVPPRPRAAPAPPSVRIHWRRSSSTGLPWAGGLARGVQLPAEGLSFFTWDPVRRRSPNRPWRRFGNDRLVRMVVQVAAEYAAAHPRAPRVGIGDLSRTRGGDFGRRYGPPGHVSHQNGLDVDVYYPRADGTERAPPGANHVDRRLAQDLVDRFVQAGAEKVFVGPGTGLRGPARIVQILPHHDNHLHVRIAGVP